MRRPMPDLVVVVPGILGSTLSRDGSPIWGYRAMLRHPRLLGARLALQPDDTAVPTGLLTFPVHLPGLGKLDIYGPVVESLMNEFELQLGENLLLFAYDWRRSCRESASKLRAAVDDALQRWRRASDNERAGVLLVCHSMGGLVARWYLDVLLRGQAIDHIRALVTIGTPYQGSVKAVGAIVNGVLGWTGATGRRLTTALRGFPSVYELLPRYDCVEPPGGTGRPLPLAAAGIEWPSTDLCSAAADFHAELAAAPLPYDLQAIIAKSQRTPHRVSVYSPYRVELLEADESGDGTVPRDGAKPYGWRSMSAAKWIDQSHAAMHNGRDAWVQLKGIVSEDWEADMSLFTGLALQVPEALPLGEPLRVLVRPTSVNARPPLRLDVTHTETGELVAKCLLDESHGTYTAVVEGLEPGVHRVTIHDPSGVWGVTPITDLISVI